MADELTMTLTMTYKNGNAADSVAAGALKYSQVNQLIASGIQSIGTSAENLGTGDVGTTGGWLWMRNLSSVNYVTFGADDSGTQKTCGRLPAGHQCLFFLEAGTTLKLTANTAAVNVQYKLFAL